MNASMFDFLMIGIIGILFIFSISVGLHRMVRIIIGSYLLMATSLATFSLIEFCISALSTTTLPIPNVTEIITYMTNYKQYINMIFYFILFLLIFKKFNIIQFGIKNKIVGIILLILFTPFTVMSIAASLEVAVFGYKVIDYAQLTQFALQFQNNPWIFNFFKLTPIWIVLPGVVALIFSLFVSPNND